VLDQPPILSPHPDGQEDDIVHIFASHLWKSTICGAHKNDIQVAMALMVVLLAGKSRSYELVAKLKLLLLLSPLASHQ
jgi:hypothetical protein